MIGLNFSNEMIEALAEKDDILKGVILSLNLSPREIIEDPFIALVNSIVYQQISYKAGNTVWNRFTERFESITPESILSFSQDEIASVGLSGRKAMYIHNIARTFSEKELSRSYLDTLEDEEIIQLLTGIKGIGIWSAEMFLIFSMGRLDVMSYSDLGLRKAVEFLYNVESPISKNEFDEITRKWSPYRTIASFYLWELSIQKKIT